MSSSDPQKWARTHILAEHDSFVSGIDWSSNNQIVSCGHDRNAYVWELIDHQWKPKLVILRIPRAATGVQWSPLGTKFAVSSGAKMVPVCYFGEENDWWVSQLIKKHRSTVLCVDWHPNNNFLVTGSSDMRCRIFSAYMEEVDGQPDSSWDSIFPAHAEFGALLAKFEYTCGWIESVRWAPSGFHLAFTGHDSSVNFVHIYGEGDPYVVPLNHQFLPFRDIAFLSDYCLVAVGYDSNPLLFVNQNTADDPKWQFVEKVDKETGGSKKKKQSGFSKKMNMFEDVSSKGVEFGQQVKGQELNTVHQNCITQVSTFPDAQGGSVTFVTSGIDGRVQYWNLAGGNFDLAALGLQF